MEELDGDEEADTLPSRFSIAISRTQCRLFFRILVNKHTLYCGFILLSVTPSLPESPGLSRLPAVFTSSEDDGLDPIGGAVAGCGISGRAVEKFSLLAPARVRVEHSRWYQPYESRGVGAATDLSPEERRDWFG